MRQMRDTCVAFGTFDGVHTGHRAVVETLVKTAGERGLAPVLAVFQPDGANGGFLTTWEEKQFLLREFRLADIIPLPYRPADASFVREVLQEQLDAKAVVVGGNHESLSIFRQIGGKSGIDVIECELVMADGLPVSAGLISRMLAANRLDRAERLLGHPHIVMGKVVAGKQLGRTIGQPTANIDFSQSKILPPDGSYITVTILDGERRVGLTNIGKRPTVDNYDYTTVENHILDFSGDLYGKELVVEFLKFIRGVEKFESLAAVKVQIDKDIESLRGYIDSIA